MFKHAESPPRPRVWGGALGATAEESGSVFTVRGRGTAAVSVLV